MRQRSVDPREENGSRSELQALPGPRFAPKRKRTNDLHRNDARRHRPGQSSPSELLHAILPYWPLLPLLAVVSAIDIVWPLPRHRYRRY